ncbi:MAG: helix-turn-helix domain-containing protein [Sulfurimonas sp.]|nr:helix-turn-helix domain-containing protein [Sulfurimonas sp.]
MSKTEIDEIFEKLFQYFHVTTISDLADKLNMSQPSVSNWRSRNSVSAIKKKCRELDIYNEIFRDMNAQTIYSNSGQVAQNVNGNQTFSPATKKEKEDDVDDATYSLFLEAYKKALKNDDLKGLRVHLMDY